jgi:hypothetical protein
MEQPSEFITQGETKKVCLLKWAIYGLKQSLRAWFVKLSSVLLALRFYKCTIDSSVFTKKGPQGIIIFTAYVDILLIGDDVISIKATKVSLQKVFALWDLRSL